MIESLKQWIVTHKALAVGGGLALLLLVYLWWRSGTAAPAASGDQALTAYYAASAAAAGDAAAAQHSTNQLAASTAQTQAAKDVSLAQYSTYLDAIKQQANLQAYHDYLAERLAAGPGTSDANATKYVSPGGHTLIQTFGQVAGGDPTHMYDITTGQIVPSSSALWPVAGTGTAVRWEGPGSTPVVPKMPSPTLTFQQFIAGTSGGVPTIDV